MSLTTEAVRPRRPTRTGRSALPTRCPRACSRASRSAPTTAATTPRAPSIPTPPATTPARTVGVVYVRRRSSRNRTPRGQHETQLPPSSSRSSSTRSARPCRRSASRESPSPRSRVSAARRATPSSTAAPSTSSISCPKVKIEAAIADDLVERVIEAIEKSANTGKIGDGKIFVFDLEQVVRIRTGETGAQAL